MRRLCSALPEAIVRRQVSVVASQTLHVIEQCSESRPPLAHSCVHAADRHSDGANVQRACITLRAVMGGVLGTAKMNIACDAGIRCFHINYTHYPRIQLGRTGNAI